MKNITKNTLTITADDPIDACNWLTNTLSKDPLMCKAITGYCMELKEINYNFYSIEYHAVLYTLNALADAVMDYNDSHDIKIRITGYILYTPDMEHITKLDVDEDYYVQSCSFDEIFDVSCQSLQAFKTILKKSEKVLKTT